MNITRYDEQESVKDAIDKNEPLMAVISFDGKEAYVSHLDVGDVKVILPKLADAIRKYKAGKATN